MKRILLSIFIVALILFVHVSAETCDSGKISISSFEVLEKSDNVVISDEDVFDGNKLVLNFSMSEVGDNIKYRVSIKNDSSLDYELDENSISINSQYLDYSIDTVSDNTIKAKSSKELFLNVSYENEVPASEFSSGSFNNKETVVFDFSHDEVPNLINIITNPQTLAASFLVLVVVIVLIIITILFILKKKPKKNIMLLLLPLLFIPFSVYAICKYELKVESNIEIVEPKTCLSFDSDSWEIISKNVKENKTECYSVGDTKNVELSGIGTFTVRISNMSTPEVCSNPEFSQTACGFVVEFQDIIQNKQFNTTSSNSGGWENSFIREYLNTEILSKMPSDLQEVISPTYVVSGHEKGKSSNYITTDKLYLLATGELWQKVGTDDIGYDSADTLTRQLDYYAAIPVTSTSCEGAIKKYRNYGMSWWLRSAHKTSDNYIGNVQANGKTNSYYGHASLSFGVSPAFKIA